MYAWSEKEINFCSKLYIHLSVMQDIAETVIKLLPSTFTCTLGLRLSVVEQLFAVQTSVAVEELVVLPTPAKSNKYYLL